MEDKTLSVRLGGKHIGILRQDKGGKFEFMFEKCPSRTLSFSLPYKKEQYEDNECRGYFSGLLPEGDEQRRYIAKKYSINPKNDFSMLRAIGADCAGAVSFHQLNEKEIKADYVKLQGTPISDRELARHIKELPEKPLFMGVKDFRLSLAGMQDKGAVCVIDNKICMPAKNCPTTHILKPQIQNLRETIENEYLCLTAAKKMGIETPDVEIRRAESTKYLLIKRYDRDIKDGKITRIHQEDFCQALGIAPAFKYQSDGGASLKDCFKLLEKTAQPAKDRLRLVEMVIFNFLTGNADAHGKNFSILHLENNSSFLAPAYDILCTMVYEGEKMAMKIGGNYRYDKILPRHFEKMCKEADLSYTQVKKIIARYADELPGIIKDVIYDMKAQGLSIGIAKKISEFSKKQCEKMFKRLYE